MVKIEQKFVLNSEPNGIVQSVVEIGHRLQYRCRNQNLFPHGEIKWSKFSGSESQ